jgi:hypothetical protein
MRDRFLEEWLARTLRTYPQQAGRFLIEEPDPFRNPVGHTLGAALGALADELFGGFDRARVTVSLDAVIRLRAVQDFSPAEAVGFVTLAHGAADRVAEAGPPGLVAEWRGVLDARIDELVLIAAGLFERCRDEIYAIGERAAHRRVFVPERAQQRAIARAAARGDVQPSASRGDIQ